MDDADKRRWIEIAAVFLTGAGKFFFMDMLQVKLPFIIIAILFWVSYIFYQNRKHSGILNHWGFRRDNFWTVVKMVLPFGAIAVLGCFAIGFYRGTINLTWHILPILLLYPIWGIVQQFLVIGLVAGNFKDQEQVIMSDRLIILITALLFGLLHYPNYWLILGTFVLALLYGFIYLRARNVFVMGLFHGWLGALFYYTVVGRDPFAEVFGKWL